MNARDVAARLLTLRVVKDWITAEDRALRENVTAGMVVGERVPGLLDPADPATVLGFVTCAKGRETATVTDPAEFLAWVRAVAPTEIVDVPTVRPSFAKQVLLDVQSHGGWISPDGELLAPDGVEVRTGEPTLRVVPGDDAERLVRDALAARRIALGTGT